MPPDQRQLDPDAKRTHKPGRAFPFKVKLSYRERVLFDEAHAYAATHTVVYADQTQSQIARDLLMGWADKQLLAKEARQPDVSGRG